MGISPILVLVLIVVLYLISSIKILVEYEWGVIFRLGKLLSQPKGPGVTLVFAPIDRIVRVSLRTVVFDVPPQDVITPRQRLGEGERGVSTSAYRSAPGDR